MQGPGSEVGVLYLVWEKLQQANASGPARLQGLEVALVAFFGFSEQLLQVLTHAHPHTRMHTHLCTHMHAHMHAHTCVHTHILQCRPFLSELPDGNFPAMLKGASPLEKCNRT